MPECRTELDEMLKPGTVRHLLKKREILRSITEDVTQGNVEYSQRFMDYEKVSQADVQRHVKDIPKLEKEVQELGETVNTMKEERRADRTAMLNEVQQLYGAPLHAITERQRRSMSAKDSKKALPLLLKLVQNLYLEFTINYKWRTLLKISDAFQREERSGFRMLLREMPFCKGADRQGWQRATEIDLAGQKRVIGYLMQKLAFMSAVDEDPLGDMPEVPEPSRETIDAVRAGPNPHFLKQIDALKDKSANYLRKRSEARIPLVTGAHTVFGIAFQLADDARVNALPLHECKQALQTFVKLAQNLHEEITVCGKDHVDLQRELDLSTLEKKLYKDAYLELLEKLDEQLAAASNANTDESNGSISAEQKSA